MKKVIYPVIICFCIFLVLAVFQITGTGDGQTSGSEAFETASETASDSEESAAKSDSQRWQINEIKGEETSFITSAADLYATFGYGWFQCKKSGDYRFYPDGNLYDSCYSGGDHTLVWKVFILEEPFSDTPTGIPYVGEQVRNYIEGEYIEKGSYIVIYCDQNVKTYGLNQSGDEAAQFVCEFQEEL